MTISLRQTQHDVVGLLRENQAPKALNHVSHLIRQYPKEGMLYELKGHCLMALEKDTQQVLDAFLTGHKMLPSSANIAAYIGGIYYQQSMFGQAQEYFEKALKIDPTIGKAWHLLSVILLDKKQLEAGLRCQQKALENDPFKPQIEQAKRAFLAKNATKTQQICERILAQHGAHSEALLLLAKLHLGADQLEHAKHALEQGLTYSPYDYELLLTASQVEAQLRDYQQALAHSERLTHIFTDSVQGMTIHADNQMNAGLYQSAAATYKSLSRFPASQANGILQQAHIAKILGHSIEAAGLYSSALKHDASKGSAFWALSGMRNYHFSKRQLTELESIQYNPDIEPEQACQASFALAKHYELNQDFANAFALYQSANLSKPAAQFDIQKYQLKCKALISTFNQASLENRADICSTSATPIFIVGLPRSGSTLVEQILSGHSQVEATMELKLLPAIAKKMYLDSCEKNQNSSGDLSKFSAQELAQYGEWYIQKSQIYRTNKHFFIDKLPPNFQHVGLIKMILPHAIIIDARRQPLACGLGIYKQYFGHGHDFAYRLEHIGFYYNQYLALMDHWNQALPDQVLCVQHEELVLEPLSQVKRILEYCHLAFEKNCLAIENNTRPIRTASSEQVRQPIYQYGLALWKHYDTQLDPLKVALGKVTLARFSRWIQ